MSGNRARLITLLALLVVVLAGLLIAGRPWWHLHADDTAVALSGTDSTGGLATGLVLIVAGGLPLVLVLRTPGRRIVGVLLALTGVGMALAGALASEPNAELVRTQLRQHTLAEASDITRTGWPIGYAVLGVVLVATAVFLVISAPGWPVRSDRFDRRRHDVGTDDPHEVWKALDAGVDPTEAEPEAINDPEPETISDPEVPDTPENNASDPTQSGTVGPKPSKQARMAPRPATTQEER